jgi:hypothetical protein
MKKWFVVIFLVLFSLLSLIIVRSVFEKTSYCGVSFEDAVYEFTDSNDNSIFVIDEAGNLYLNASSVDLNVVGDDPNDGMALKFGSLWYWTFSNNLAQIKGGISDEATLTEPVGNDMVLFRNPVNSEPLVLFDTSDGKIFVKGRAVYTGAQANCDPDTYEDVLTNRVYRDNFCDVGTCNSRDENLDLDQDLCLGEFDGWQLGGDQQGDCCGNNESEEVLDCSGECGLDSGVDGCCDLSSDCVFDGDCYDTGVDVCAPWDSDSIGLCNSNVWSEGDNCLNECDNNCSAYSGCAGGSCDGTNDCLEGETCSAGNGCSSSQPICDATERCSLSESSHTYGVLGNFSCQSGCDGSGDCNNTILCDDCNIPGSGVDLCLCACNDHNIDENVTNENCLDGIDNDCDGDIDGFDSNCCEDQDGDGWGTASTYLACPNPTGIDCDDNDNLTYPGTTTTDGCGQVGCCLNSFKECLDTGEIADCSFTGTSTASSNPCFGNEYDWNCDGTDQKVTSYSTATSCTPFNNWCNSGSDTYTCPCGDSCSISSCSSIPPCDLSSGGSVTGKCV